jgi:hypothetical protein
MLKQRGSCEEMYLNKRVHYLNKTSKHNYTFANQYLN